MLDEENCIYYGKKIIQLSKLQSKLLELLIKNKGKITLYRETTMALYGQEPYKMNKRLIRYIVECLNNLLEGEVVIKLKNGYGWHIET